MINEVLKDKLLDYGEFNMEQEQINVPIFGANSQQFLGTRTVNLKINHKYLTEEEISFITGWQYSNSGYGTGKADFGPYSGVFPIRMELGGNSDGDDFGFTEFGVDHWEGYPPIKDVEMYKIYRDKMSSKQRKEVLLKLKDLNLEDNWYCEEQLLLEI